jgi:hypothetical protein
MVDLHMVSSVIDGGSRILRRCNFIQVVLQREMVLNSWTVIQNRNVTCKGLEGELNARI